jgi:tetratricopeptide (TPR) repeat protein
VAWFDGGLALGLDEAGTHGRLLLADVGAYWCAPCRELDETVFTDPKVGAFLAEHFVAVHVDAEKGEGPELVERYKIQIYPTLLVLEPSGVERGRVFDVEDASGLMASLNTLIAGGDVFEGLEKQLARSPEDLELAYRLGSRHAQAAHRDPAERLFARVLEGDPNNEKGLAAKVLYDRAMFFDFKMDADPDAAVRSYRDLQARYPDSKEAERAYRQIGRALNSQGKPDEAIASLDAMLALRPDDPGLHSSYGWFSFRQKCRPDKGLVVVRRGLELEPENAGLHYLEAELHHLLGDDDAAARSMERGLEIEPMSAYYKRQRRRFADLASRGVAPSGPE